MRGLAKYYYCVFVFQGIIERDQVVFQKARTRGIPIFMVTSGGYMRETARIIADSILNLKNLHLISCEEAEHCPPPEQGQTLYIFMSTFSSSKVFF
jgi:hypothetical protein